MNNKMITITSKNQITLPIEYVRMMNLAQNRVLQGELRGKSIILTPQPTLGERMRQYWGKHKANHPVSDEDMKQAIRKQAVMRLTKSV
jgi:bifunctional DNA-binding transcriptional regulator/antitoxin component of YhaV-PrlF toxin-antitoxin module